MRCVVVILGIASAVLAGCSFDLDACATDDDCPTGTTCHRPTGTEVPMCLERRETGTNNSDVDLPSETDSGPVADVPTGVVDPDDGPDTEECAVFNGCGADEPNDDPRNAVLLNDELAGCPGFELESWAKVRRDEACDGDVDYYALEYVPCEHDSFEIEVSVETSEHCSGRPILEILGGPHRCGVADVSCTVEDRREAISIVVPPAGEFGAQSETLLVTVRPDSSDSGIQYILRGNVGR